MIRKYLKTTTSKSQIYLISMFIIFISFSVIALCLLSEIHETKEDLSDLVESVNTLSSEIDTLNKKVKDLESKLSDMEISIKEYEDNISENSAEETSSGVGDIPDVEDMISDVTTPSNISEAQLEVALLGDLKDYASIFLQAEDSIGINAIFLSSVAALESGWATSNASEEYNNLFGWMSSGNTFVYFETREDCILQVAERIYELYLKEDGIYHEGYSVSDINIRYNGKESWEDSVSSIMKDIHSRATVGGEVS